MPIKTALNKRSGADCDFESQTYFDIEIFGISLPTQLTQQQ
jgi:hypothetical protein